MRVQGRGEGIAFDGISQSGRRAAVVFAAVGFPIFIAAWLLLPVLGIPPLAWAAVVGIIGLGIVLVDYGLWSFRQAMAQAPDDRLDERELAVRDRAYLESYRIFAALVLLGVVAAGILPDLLDRPLMLTFETMQPLVWGVIHYSIILPSAVVAWWEPDPVTGEAA